MKFKKDFLENARQYKKLLQELKKLIEEIMRIKYQWFVEPLDSLTNETISRELTEENCLRGALCADGKKRNLWSCDYSLISKLRRSRKIGLKFNVFVRQGGGKIRQFKL